MSISEPEGVKEDVATGPVAGERLRLAREGLELSVQDIAEKIRIDIHKVKALESDDVDVVGAPVFVAGYIRAYARIVALPADELIAEYEGVGHINNASAHSISATNSTSLGRVTSELPAAFSMNSSRRGWKPFIRWIGIGILLVVIAAAALWFVKGRSLFSVESTDGGSGLMSLPHNSASGNDVGGQQTLVIPGQDDSVPDRDGDIDDGRFSTPFDSAARDDSSVAGAEVDTEATVAPVEVASLDDLILTFQDDSWVEVNDAHKKRLIHQLARAGQTHTLQGAAPFSLTLGYVPGVIILLNGEEVDLSKYQGRRLVHLTVGKEVADEN